MLEMHILTKLFGTNWVSNIVQHHSIKKSTKFNAQLAFLLKKEKNRHEYLETLHLAPTLFYHLPGVYLKTGFLNPHPLSLDCCVCVYPSIYRPDCIKGCLYLKNVRDGLDELDFDIFLQFQLAYLLSHEII